MKELTAKSKYEPLYSQEDSYFLLHEHDPDLATIKVDLPSVESFYQEPRETAIRKIDGYGLRPEDQKFVYQVVPEKLRVIKQLMRKKYSIKKSDPISWDQVYDEIEENQIEYKEEIKWIKIQQKRRIVGYWFFNNGKPTYIDGWHYFFINNWDIQNDKREDGLPFYRNVDRKIFLFARVCYTTTTAPYKFRCSYRSEGIIKEIFFHKRKDADEFCQRNPASYMDEGSFIVDMGHRTCYGYIFPKRRRVGATSQAACILYCITTEKRQGKAGIQSITDDQAKKDVYLDKIVKPWRKIPFIFKPSHDGTDMPKERIQFSYPANRKEGDKERALAHDGWIEPRSSSERAFDGTKLSGGFLDDEGGKHREGALVSVSQRWQDVVKKCLAQGMDVQGLAAFTSTLGEFEGGGGKEFFEIIRQSHYDERNENGFTTSGLFCIFIPAFDGYDSCVDEYGESVIDDPEEPVKALGGGWITRGAKTILMNTRNDLEAKGLLDRLNGEIRDNPWTLQEAITKSTRNTNFDQKILRKRIAELKLQRGGGVRRVSLDWTDGFGSDVKVVDDENGRFFFSYIPPSQRRNKKLFDQENDQYMPHPEVCDKMVLGADPFKFAAKDIKGKKKSNGAGALFLKHDSSIDTADVPFDQWMTHKFVMHYNCRVDDPDKYCEDMLMVCILTGAMINTETNVTIVMDNFRKWKFGGYLWHNTDVNGVVSKTPGTYTTDQVKEEIFSAYMSYIKFHGATENHLPILEECSDIDDPTQMTRYDLFAAGGMALLGIKSMYPGMLAAAANKEPDGPILVGF